MGIPIIITSAFSAHHKHQPEFGSESQGTNEPSEASAESISIPVADQSAAARHMNAIEAKAMENITFPRRLFSKSRTSPVVSSSSSHNPSEDHVGSGTTGTSDGIHTPPHAGESRHSTSTLRPPTEVPGRPVTPRADLYKGEDESHFGMTFEHPDWPHFRRGPKPTASQFNYQDHKHRQMMEYLNRG